MQNALPLAVLLALASGAVAAEPPAQISPGIVSDVTAWRRDFHQHPELSNREVRTSKIVADELKKLGYTVRTGIAHTGVTGVLNGGKPGPKLAIRADMDALPVKEHAVIHGTIQGLTISGDATRMLRSTTPA